ncbi:MAG: HDOD domain-containing protein [Proteobacteria bacterium]|nr:HDOD domain-containing protein [Pseudomonadota bacterium]
MDKSTKCPKCKTANPSDMRFCGACGTHLATDDGKKKDPLVGTLVGNRFVILEKIGQGGMGVVYKGEQTAIWRPVALKVLRPKFSQDKKLHERFRNEASTASRLTHPNTITIYDFGVLDDNGLYIAMEFIEGKSLDDEIDTHGVLDWQRSCRIAMQICGSLQEAHEHNIIHRDLKPDNIMLTRRGAESDVVKVLDFGIAKIMADEESEYRPSLTAADEIFGTPEYMAPEQIRGEKLDPRTDIYAMGNILYRMMTGSLPFTSDAPLALLAKHLMEEPIPIDNHESSQWIPTELKSLIMSSLSKNRDDRPASMGYILDQLLEAHGGTLHGQSTSIRVAEVISQSLSRPKAVSHVAKTELQLQAPDIENLSAEAVVRQAEKRDHSAVEKALDRAAAPAETMHCSRELDKQIEDEPEEEGWLEVEEPYDEPVKEERAEQGTSDDDLTVKKKKKVTLDAIIAKTKKNSDFPTMSYNITRLNSNASRQDTSVHKLANVILKSYGLTSKLLKLVNSPYFGQYRGRVMTVSRTVLIMGFEQVRQIAIGLMLFENLQAEDRHQAKSMLDSAYGLLMSGLVAMGIAREMGIEDQEEAFVCAIFRRLGEYVCIYYLPDEYREIRRLVKQNGKIEYDTARHVLGMSFEELGQTMAEEWKFPDEIQKSMNSLPKGNLPKPRDNIEMLRNLSGFADELTKLAAGTRPANRKASLRKLANRFKDSCPVSDEQLGSLLTEATEEVRDYSKILNLNLQESPFIQRVLHWSGVIDLPATQAGRRMLVSEFPKLDTLDPPPTIVEEPRVDQFKERKQILTSGTEEVTVAMTGLYDLNAIIMMVLETMYRGLGLSRVIFCLNEVKARKMIARSGFGDGADEMIRQFRFQPRPGRDLFNRAVSRGADVIVNDTRDPRYVGKLPAWYRRITDTSIILLYPVMIRNYPAGLFYGDVLDSKTTINRGLLVHMDKLRNIAARAIREKGSYG